MFDFPQKFPLFELIIEQFGKVPSQNFFGKELIYLAGMARCGGVIFSFLKNICPWLAVLTSLAHLQERTKI